MDALIVVKLVIGCDIAFSVIIRVHMVMRFGLVLLQVI